MGYERAWQAGLEGIIIWQAFGGDLDDRLCCIKKHN